MTRAAQFEKQDQGGPTHVAIASEFMEKGTRSPRASPIDLARGSMPPIDWMGPPPGIVIAGAEEVHDATGDEGADEQEKSKEET